MDRPPPFYVKQADIRVQNDKNTALFICQQVDHYTNGECVGAQYQNGVWAIYVKSTAGRLHMIDQIKYITIDSTNITIYDSYPKLTKKVPTEMIIFKDVPWNMDDRDIMSFLNKQEGITVASRDVMFSRIRDESGKLTQFYSGDRFVYVHGKFSPVLPEYVDINSHQCRVWHRSQADACGRCRKLGHHVMQTDRCPAYVEQQNIEPIRSPAHPMSNFFMCNINIYDKVFASSEHAYQYKKMIHVGRQDYADEILNALLPTEVKAISRRVPRDQLDTWNEVKLMIMAEILDAKLEQCHEFRTSLLQSEGKTLVETTKDIFWGNGMNENTTENTLPSFFIGTNILGELLELIRENLLEGGGIVSLDKQDVTTTQDDGNDVTATVSAPGSSNSFHAPSHTCIPATQTPLADKTNTESTVQIPNTSVITVTKSMEQQMNNKHNSSGATGLSVTQSGKEKQRRFIKATLNRTLSTSSLPSTGSSSKITLKTSACTSSDTSATNKDKGHRLSSLRDWAKRKMSPGKSAAVTQTSKLARGESEGTGVD